MAANREQSPFGTVLTAMVTPMNRDGSVDYPGVAQLAAYLVENGNDGIVVNGTTGEAPTTTGDEKLRILRTVVETVGSDVAVVAGVGTNDTAHTIELARQAQAVGVTGLLAVTPYYNRPPQAGVIAHFMALANSVDVPIMLYDIPARTATAIEPESLIELSAHPNIVAVKDAKGDLESVVDVQRQTDLLWYSGDDGLNLQFLSIGAAGFVSVTGHIVGLRLAELAQAYFEGDVARAIAINEALQPVSTGLFRTQGAILTKAALDELGLPAGPLRLPLIEATEQQRAQLRADLAAGRVAGFVA